MLILTYFVEVERKVPGDGAIETRLEVGCPPVTETMRPAPVVFADSRYARVDGLRKEKIASRKFRPVQKTRRVERRRVEF